ncbi:MAG TPA: nuclear transport factor 2 family protein, partial [Pseudonocardia sp.]
RHGNGLEYASFAVDERQVRQDGGTALVTARLNAAGSFRGAPVPEAVRATVVLTDSGGRWRLVRVHMSFIAGTAGAPPVPGRAAGPAS